MLLIQTTTAPTVCNVLPCRIRHTGPTEATEKHWIVLEGENGKKTASFRGRKLAGKIVPVPEGYRGHVLEVTDEKAPAAEGASPSSEGAGEESVEIFKGLATFDEIAIWGHDSVPDGSSDGVIRGIEELVGFASRCHDFEMGEEEEEEGEEEGSQ